MGPSFPLLSYFIQQLRRSRATDPYAAVLRYIQRANIYFNFYDPREGGDETGPAGPGPGLRLRLGVCWYTKYFDSLEMGVEGCLSLDPSRGLFVKEVHKAGDLLLLILSFSCLVVLLHTFLGLRDHS